MTWRFEYGRGTAYNRATRLQTLRGGNQGTVSVGAQVKGLSPHARYHYRLVVFSQTSGSAVAHGADLTFTTKATGRLLGPMRRVSTSRRAIRVAQTCQSKVLCAGSFSLATTVRVGRKRRARPWSARPAAFASRPTARLSLWRRLSAACSKLLRAAPHHRLTVTYAARSRTGQIGLRRRITLVLR